MGTNSFFGITGSPQQEKEAIKKAAHKVLGPGSALIFVMTLEEFWSTGNKRLLLALNMNNFDLVMNELQA